MANNSTEKANTNNLESDNKERTPYKIEFGVFQQIEKNKEKTGKKIDVLDLPPKNSKEYKDLLKVLDINNEMIIEAKTYQKIIGEDKETVVARVEDGSGKVLSGNTNVRKSSKKSNEQEK